MSGQDKLRDSFRRGLYNASIPPCSAKADGEGSRRPALCTLLRDGLIRKIQIKPVASCSLSQQGKENRSWLSLNHPPVERPA